MPVMRTVTCYLQARMVPFVRDSLRVAEDFWGEYWETWKRERSGGEAPGDPNNFE